MRFMGVLIILAMIFMVPAHAKASIVWQDTNIPDTLYTGESDSYYSVSTEVLSELSPGSYTFTMGYQTVGTWDTSGSMEDYVIAMAGFGTNIFRDVESSMQGEGLYSISLPFEVAAVIPSFLTFSPFLIAFSDVTGVDEVWKVTSAQITDPTAIPSPTPIPGAALLLGSGLLGLLGVRRRLNS